MNELTNLEYLLEVSPFRGEYLKNIDRAFIELKRDRSDLQAKKDLINAIKEFSGINSVILTLKKDYLNASILTMYTRDLAFEVSDLFKDFEPSHEKIIKTIEEPNKYIRKIYIILGVEMLNTFSPKELTAIMLHELGHSYSHTANLPRIILYWIRKVISISIPARIIGLFILEYFKTLSWTVGLGIGLAFFITSKSLTFVEHRGEYKADQFVAKYGYGEEIMRVMLFFHEKYIKQREEKPWYLNLLDSLYNFFIYSSPHPKSKKRIKAISNKMFNDYKQMYPKLSNELNIIINDVKSEA